MKLPNILKSKFVIFGVFFICLLFGGTAMQAYCQTVQVSQEFVDRATQAFNLVVEQRKALEEFQKERVLNQAERAATNAAIAGLNEVITLKDKTIASFEKLITVYENIIRIQNSIIEQLEKRLLKPRTFFQKFLQGLKETLLIVGGIVIGRGL